MDSIDTDSKEEQDDPPDNQELLDAIFSVANYVPAPAMVALEA